MQVNIKDRAQLPTITIYLPGPYLGHNVREESLRVK